MSVSHIFLLTGIVVVFFAIDYIYRRQRCPLPKSVSYEKNTCLRKDGETIMLYRLRNTNFSWWQKLYLPFVSEADAYWFATPANAEQCARYEHTTYVEQCLAAGGM